MLPNLSYLLVTAICFICVCTAIRVEWNTYTTTPQIPPTPRTTVKPEPPFRDPAPVWEDNTNDIPNPNPYVYVPPPPSRPKQRLNTNVHYYDNSGNGNNYGIIATPQNAINFYQQNNNNSPQVASLAPQYVPNIGTRYVAIVPTTITTNSSNPFNKYSQTPAANSLLPNKTAYKLNGKYNVKTKKYKVYEKVKYVPLNYYPSFKASDNTTVAQAELLSVQQPMLPNKHLARKWFSPFDFLNITLPKKENFAKLYTKHVYAKDKTTIKTKEKFNDYVVTTNKS